MQNPRQEDTSSSSSDEDKHDEEKGEEKKDEIPEDRTLKLEQQIFSTPKDKGRNENFTYFFTFKQCHLEVNGRFC